MAIGRARVVAGRIASAIGVALVFVLAVALAVVLHLDHPAARRFAVARTEAALAPLFEGKIVIDHVDRLSLAGLAGGAAKVVAPDGTVVVRADGVRASGNVLGILRSAVLGKGPIIVPIDEVTIDYAEVVLDAAADGTPKLRAAFRQRPPLSPASPNARGVDLSIAKIVVRTAWVHGQVPGTPPSDIQVDGAAGALVFRAGALKVDARRFALHTRGAPRGLDADGTGEAHLAFPGTSGPGVAIEGSFKGTVGGIGATMRGAIDGARVDVTLDVPRAPADRVRALFPDAPAQAELGVRVDAHGLLPRLDLDARVTLGTGALHVVGPVIVEGERRAALVWDVESLDLRAFAVTAPVSSLRGRGTVDATIASDASLAGTFTADVGAGTLGGQSLPAATLRGTFSRNANVVRAHAEGKVHEVGAPTDLTLDVGPDGTSWALDATARSVIPRLEAVPRLGTAAELRGAADVRASGKLRPGVRGWTLDATLTADARGVSRGSEKIGQAHVTARATGKLFAPAISTTVDGRDIELGGMKYTHGTAKTHGSTTAQHVELTLQGDGTPDVTGAAEVALGGKIVVHNADLTLTRDKVAVSVRVPTVRFGTGELHVEDAEIRGLGALARVTVDVREGSTLLRARSRGVSIERVAHLLHLEDGSLDGRLDFDVDLELKNGGAHGDAHVSLTRGTFRGHTATAELHATAEGRRWVVTAKGTLADVGNVELATTDLEIGAEGPHKKTSWNDALGTVGLRGTADLAQLASLLPAGTLPFAPAGMVDVSGAVSRRGAARDVAVALAAGTRGLEITAKQWRVTGVEARAGATYDSAIGATAGALVLSDVAGEAARLDVQSDAVPYRELWASHDVRARLATVPLVATLVVPSRSVDALPAGLAVKGAHGTVQGTATLRGTVIAPDLRVTAAARDFAAKGTSRGGWLSGDVALRYDGKAAHVDAAVRTPKALILAGAADANARVADLLSPPPGELPWSASGRVEVMDFPLTRVAILTDHDVRGKVSGKITVEGLHEAPRASVDLSSTTLQIGNVAFPKASVSVTVDGKEARGKARLDQSIGSTAQNFLQQIAVSGGFGELAGSVGVTWGRALLPTIDATRPMSAVLATKRLRAATFLPFADAYLGELDGLVDANAIVSLMPGAEAPTVVGRATLEYGVVQIASMGTELHGVSGKLSIGADGMVRVSEVVAQGTSGTVKAAASARLEGLHVAAAAADVRIAKGDAVPLDLKGVQMGDVWGEAHLTAIASADKRTMNVTLDVPKLHVQLPLASSHSVKDRPTLTNVHVGMYTPGRFTPLALDSTDLDPVVIAAPTQTTIVQVNLGSEVDVRRGSTLAATLEGSPQITFADDARVTGQIRITSGTLQVQGKKFDIEKGTVTFVGTDASDPLVVVTAGWTATDGTRVYADFAGPLKTGKVTLRSEPSRPKDEILALILFGSADQSSTQYGGDAQADASTRAGGAAGTFAGQGLGEGISELTGLQIAPKIDTSNAANPRPEVEVQLAQTISLQIAFVLGTPPPGANPDKTFATIGWRFAQRWSLETTFGDQGSSFADVVWQLRY